MPLLRISAASLVLSLVVLLPVATASAYTVTLNGFDTDVMLTQASEQGFHNGPAVTPTALPYMHTSNGVAGNNTAETTYALTNAGFDITFEHARSNTLSSFATSVGGIYFSVDQDVNYVASGSYTVVDSEGRTAGLRVFLHDHTVGSDVFNSTQTSHMTPNQTFTLGLAEGDFNNIDTGSLSGTLIAGHDYRFFHDVAVVTSPTASTSGATATGFASLSFSVVPEPNTALLVGTGLLGLAARRRRLN